MITNKRSVKTQKAPRKDGATEADNRKTFTKTKFGRKRVSSWPVRFFAGLGEPFVAAFRIFRGGERS